MIGFNEKKYFRRAAFALVALLAIMPVSARAACTSPTADAGSQFYNTSYNVMQYCNGTAWVNMGAAGGAATGFGTMVSGNFCTTDGTLVNCNTSAINLSGAQATGTLATARMPALTGDVTSTVGGVATVVGKIQGVAVTASAPSNGQVLKYNSTNTQWEPGADGATASGSSGYVQFNASNALGSDSGLFWDNTNKRLGIGTASPGSPLSVVGDVRLAGNTYFGSASGGHIAADTNTLYLRPGATGLAIQNFAASTTYSFFSTAAGNSYINATGGNVGIGTTSPNAKLEVNDATSGAFRVGITQNQSNATAQIKNSIHAIASDASSVSTVGAVAWNHYNNGTSPSWTGTLAQHFGTSYAGNMFGVTAANLGALLFQNVSNGVIATNGANNIYLVPGGTSPTMTVTSSGNVGIGTTSPNDKLQVSGGGVLAFLAGASYGDVFRAYSGGGDAGVALGVPGYVGTITNHSFSLKTNNVVRATIDTSGNVGIGTTSPGAKLHIAQSLGAGVTNTIILQNTAGVDNTTLRILGAGYNSTNAQTAIDFIQSSGTTWQSQMAFSTNNGSGLFERMRLDASGNVGIGTASPSTKLYIAGSTTSYSADNANPAVYGYHTGTNHGVYGLSNGAYGVYGVTSSPSYGGVIGYSSGGTYGILAYTNAWSFYGSTSTYSGGTYQGSDVRLKENIESMSGSLAIVDKLRPVTYRWKKNTEQYEGQKSDKQMGLIAQEVQNVLPEVVTTIKAVQPPPGDKRAKTLNQELGEFFTIDYTRLVPIALEAIKELHAEDIEFGAQLSDLKAANDNLVSQNKVLHAAVEALTKDVEKLKRARP